MIYFGDYKKKRNVLFTRFEIASQIAIENYLFTVVCIDLTFIKIVTSHFLFLLRLNQFISSEKKFVKYRSD